RMARGHRRLTIWIAGWVPATESPARWKPGRRSGESGGVVRGRAASRGDRAATLEGDESLATSRRLPQEHDRVPPHDVGAARDHLEPRALAEPAHQLGGHDGEGPVRLVAV